MTAVALIDHEVMFDAAFEPIHNLVGFPNRRVGVYGQGRKQHALPTRISRDHRKTKFPDQGAMKEKEKRLDFFKKASYPKGAEGAENETPSGRPARRGNVSIAERGMNRSEETPCLFCHMKKQPES